MFNFYAILPVFITVGCIPNVDKSSQSGAQESVDSGILDDSPTDVENNDAELCHESVIDWDTSWSEIEAEVVSLVNAVRAEGTNCGEYGDQPPVGPIEMDPHLQCSRYHSIWMHQTGNFDHDSPGGDGEMIGNVSHPLIFQGIRPAKILPTVMQQQMMLS